MILLKPANAAAGSEDGDNFLSRCDGEKEEIFFAKKKKVQKVHGNLRWH